MLYSRLFTLATHLMDFNELLLADFKTPDKIQGLLKKLTPLLIKIAATYEAVGADYISLREMSGTTH